MQRQRWGSPVRRQQAQVTPAVGRLPLHTAAPTAAGDALGHNQLEGSDFQDAPDVCRHLAQLPPAGGPGPAARRGVRGGKRLLRFGRRARLRRAGAAAVNAGAEHPQAASCAQRRRLPLPQRLRARRLRGCGLPRGAAMLQLLAAARFVRRVFCQQQVGRPRRRAHRRQGEEGDAPALGAQRAVGACGGGRRAARAGGGADNQACCLAPSGQQAQGSPRTHVCCIEGAEHAAQRPRQVQRPKRPAALRRRKQVGYQALRQRGGGTPSGKGAGLLVIAGVAPRRACCPSQP